MWRATRPKCSPASPRRSRRCRSNSPPSSATSPAPASSVARRSDIRGSKPRSAKASPSSTKENWRRRTWPHGSWGFPTAPIRETSMRRWHDGLWRRAAAALPPSLALVLALAGPAAISCAWAAEPVAVEIVNASVPTLCTETDNVYLKLLSPEVREFAIEAAHPAYAGTIVADRTAPDFRNCDMSTDPVHRAEPRRVTIYETGDLQLIGYTFPSFWRPNAVPVRVGARVENGLHLIQLFVKFKERTEEVLVLYPADGYWRARPLPPEHLSYSAYGSSFLIGPIETDGRPFVDINDIAFDPATLTFRLAFARGGEARLHVEAVDREHIALEVQFDAPVAAARPFAALRSMFVTETNADVAQVAWRAPGARAIEVAPVMAFRRA